jgi:hypothetical protein
MCVQVTKTANRFEISSLLEKILLKQVRWCLTFVGLYILRGIKKSQLNVSMNRLPITSEVLNSYICNLLSTGVFSLFTDLMLQCAFLTDSLVSFDAENLPAELRMIMII